MRPEAPKYLEDVRDAASFVLAQTQPLTLDQYLSDRVLRQAIERNFEVIGEALNRLHRSDPGTASRITAVPRVIAFRNILAHAYDNLDHEIVWELIQRDLPRLLSEVESLLAEVV